MAEQPNDIKKNWTALDLGRYHAGEMSAQERHALEKATLDDPFLADALEGYAFTKTPVQDIRELTSTMEGKQKNRSTAWYQTKEVLGVSKIAAVLIIFLGLAWLLRTNITVYPQKEIAGTKVVQPSPANETTGSSAEVLSDIAEINSAVKPSEKMLKPAMTPSPTKSSQAAASQKQGGLEDLLVVARQKDYHDTLAGSTMLAAAKTASQAVEKIDLFSKEKSAASPAGINQAIEGKISGVVIRNQNTIRGRVVDNNGNPVAFANINDRQNNTVLSADKEGYFSLSNRQNVSNVKVDVNAIGFETNNIALNANTGENKIVLKESNKALSEVVVVGYGAKKRKQTVSATALVKNVVDTNSEKLSFNNIVPVAGWNNFNRFINDIISSNSDYFNKTLKDKSLRFTFDLDSAGAAVNIHPQNATGDSALVAGTRILEALPPMKKNKRDKKAALIIRF